MKKGFVALLLIMLIPSFALAADFVQAGKNAWVTSRIHVGLENKLVANKRTSFRQAEPVPQFFGRLQADVPFRLSLHLEGARRIDRENPWEAKAGVSLRLR